MSNFYKNIQKTPRGARVVLPRRQTREEDTNAVTPPDRDLNMASLATNSSTTPRSIVPANIEQSIKLAVTRAVTNATEEFEQKLYEKEKRNEEEISHLLVKVADLEAKVAENQREQPKKKRKKIPCDVSNLVHNLYRSSKEAGDCWDFSSRFDSPANNGVTLKIMETMQEQEISSPSTQRRALGRYFGSLKKKADEDKLTPNSSKRVKSNRKLITRRHKLFDQRSRIAKSVEDEAMWQELNAWYMSDVEDEEDGMYYHTLPWRRDEINELIERIDQAMGCVRRYGAPSERLPNVKCSVFVSPGYTPDHSLQ